MTKKADSINAYPVPNVRKLIIPESGNEIASVDLAGADAQTVAWESNDDDLKAALRAGIKIHAHNAKVMFGVRAPTGFEQPYYDLCRSGCHLVNFVGGIDELAHAMGFSRAEAASFRDYWFQLHPRILQWHNRISSQLQAAREVRNKFGYRRFYFDRIERILPEAIAWIAQSTTACVTNRAIAAVSNDKELLHDLHMELLFQVHDEIVFEYPAFYREQVLRKMKPLIHITVPYEDPLVIPWGLKTSMKSWGECEKRDWPANGSA